MGTLLFAVPAARAADDAGAAKAGSAAALAAPAPAGAASDDDDTGVGKDEKPEHREKRRTYIRHSKKAFGEAVHANGKALTDEERAAIRKHWHISMRLWRIRHLAEVDGNKAAVAQTDALLAKADAKTLAELKDLNAKAPAAAAATPGAK
jgi:hypothetical protein